MPRIVMYKTGKYCGQTYNASRFDADGNADRAYNVTKETLKVLIENEAGYLEGKKPPWIIAEERRLAKEAADVKTRIENEQKQREREKQKHNITLKKRIEEEEKVKREKEAKEQAELNRRLQREQAEHKRKQELKEKQEREAKEASLQKAKKEVEANGTNSNTSN